MLLPTFFSMIFWKRNPKKVMLIVGAVSCWIVVVYFISQPQEGRFFNPMTGQAMYRYARTSDNKIDLFPLGYKFHPRYGTRLESVTPEVVREIDRRAAEAVAAQEQEKERQRQATASALLAQKEQELAQQREQAREREEKETLVAQEREKAEVDRKAAEAAAAQEREKAEAVKKAEATYLLPPPPPVIAPAQNRPWWTVSPPFPVIGNLAQAQRPWTARVFDIPKGGLMVYLYPGWSDSATGGAITITLPNGRILLQDRYMNVGVQPEGIYIFRAYPPGARNIVITNRWLE
jgi:hypothetical protein